MDDQISIFDVLKSYYPESPGYQRQQTSKAAANDMKENAGTLRSACLNVLATGDYTADEIAEKLDKSILSIRPRITELNVKGRIEKTDLRRENNSGKLAIVWRIKQ